MVSPQQAQKILYVEDDPVCRELVRDTLGYRGYQMLLAADGRSGLRMAQAERPDLILLDLGLSDLDGLEVTTYLRGLPGHRKTPIVALTGRTQAGDREQALSAGCNGYIPKPFSVNRLPDQVAAYLAGHREYLSQKEETKFLRAYNHRLVKRLEDKISELDQANEALREAHHAMQKLDKMKSDFITLAAHELRTPISVVHGYAYLLTTRSEGNYSLSSEEMVQSILQASGQLNKTINDLINVANVEVGEIELFLSPSQIDYLVEAALNELSPLSQGRHLSIELIGLGDLPIFEGDLQQLQQVFWNLLSNAVKYTPDGGQIRVWGRQVEAMLEVVVEDSGIGIDPKNHETIFERFTVLEDVLYHSTSTTSFMGGGLGLGLYIARGIVEAHGGRLWVESERYDPQQCPGSKFRVRLPFAPAAAPSRNS
ncbi:MAG: hybrid sensor histidine kinase/response regulator, partial [Anaerolineae bacterium]|nr:hybrid sensor histidine kinase/response regulator [Anaerolineae bacterium]